MGNWAAGATECMHAFPAHSQPHAASGVHVCLQPHMATFRHAMRFGSTAKVLAKCMLKYYRISESSSCLHGQRAQNIVASQEDTKCSHRLSDTQMPACSTVGFLPLYPPLGMLETAMGGFISSCVHAGQAIRCWRMTWQRCRQPPHAPSLSWPHLMSLTRPTHAP